MVSATVFVKMADIPQFRGLLDAVVMVLEALQDRGEIAANELPAILLREAAEALVIDQAGAGEDG